MSQENSPDMIIDTEHKTESVVSEDVLQNLQHQSHYVSKIMRHLGIAPDHDITASMETQEQSSTLLVSYRRQLEELEEYVSLLKRGLNRWCLSVLVWEFALLALMVMVLAGGSFAFGFVPDDVYLQFWLHEAINRPVLVVMSVVVLAIIWIAIHVSLRQWQAQSVVRYLQGEVGDGRLSAAFLKNTSLWHSIFRPEPVGWSWSNRRRIHKFQETIAQAES